MIGRGLIAVLVLAFVTAYVAEAQVVTNGLIAYWTFDEADIDGDTAIDVIGGHDGTIFGNPEIVPGKVNEGLEFNGTTDYIEAEIPDNLLADGTTIELWFFQQEAQATWGLILKIDPEKIEFDILAGGVIHVWSGVGSFNLPGMFSDGNWHHAAVLVSEDNVVAYLDGEQVGENGAGLSFEAVSKVTIARDPGGSFWPGMIDEIRIYGRPLSEEEIQQNMAAEGLSVGKPADKLIETWGKMKSSS